MGSSGLLLTLTFLGSAVSWWPIFAFDVPLWIAFGCVVLSSCLSMVLVPSILPWLLLASGIGTLVGFTAGPTVWPLEDGIAAAWTPYVAAVYAIAVMFVGIFLGLIIRNLSVSSKMLRRTIWGAWIACVAFAPLSFALAPTLIPHWIARNERLADERFTALKEAMERAVQAYSSSHISDGRALKPHYSGPVFSDSDWSRIGRTRVKQDGYYFVIYPSQDRGYTVSATPVKERVSGVRQFCTDESGKVGCRVEWNGSRNLCLPCSPSL